MLCSVANVLYRKEIIIVNRFKGEIELKKLKTTALDRFSSDSYVDSRDP